MAILRSLPVLLAADAAFRLAAGLLRGAGLVLLPWGLFVAWCGQETQGVTTLRNLTPTDLAQAQSLTVKLE